eukprot:Polyplicarium_translucidae@DN3144_c0_g1_i2.p1
MRYLAKKIGEYGSNQRNDYIADMVMDKLSYWRDEQLSAFQTFHGSNCGKLSQRYLGVRQEEYARFEKILAASPTQFFATDKPTWSDFSLFAALWDDQRLTESPEADAPPFGPDLLPDHPRLQALHDEICRLPLIEAYIVEALHGENAEAASDQPDSTSGRAPVGEHTTGILPAVASQQLWSDHSVQAAAQGVPPMMHPMMMGSFPGAVMPRAAATSSLAMGGMGGATFAPMQHPVYMHPQFCHQVDPRTFGRFSDEE